MTKPANPRSSRRPIAIVAALAALAAGGYGYQLWRAADAAAALRERTLADVAKAVAAQPVDAGELSRAAADLLRLPEHDTDAELVMAHASLELARDRAERAEALFASIGGRPDAPPAQQRLVARILLRRQEGDVGDRAAAMLRQVVDLSMAAHADGRDANDLFRAWQAAIRLPDEALAARLAQQLAAEQPEAPASRFVQFASAFDPAAGVAAVAAAAAGLLPEPAEAVAMRVMALLQLGDLAAATAAGEAALARYPGVATVRLAAVGVFHAMALGSASGSAERTRWLERRDAQIAWVLAAPGLPEARRAMCRELRDAR